MVTSPEDGTEDRTEDSPAIRDKYAREDKLGIEADVEGLTDLIEGQIEDEATPVTVAVQGAWGSGKTSIMKMVDARLEGKSQIATAWIDTWSYAHLRDPAALPAAVMYDLATQLDKSEEGRSSAGGKDNGEPAPQQGGSEGQGSGSEPNGEKIGKDETKVQKFERLTKALLSATTEIGVPVLIAAVNALAPAPVGAVATAATEATQSRLSRRKKAKISAGSKEALTSQPAPTKEPVEDPGYGAAAASEVKTVRELREAFKGAIEETGRSWVIFVDDLDRLPPARAVEVMEAIQVFLSVEGCVFVLAIDFEVVREGVKSKYQAALPDGADGGFDDTKARSFFDKLVQLPFEVPQSRYTFTAYLESMLNDSDLLDLLGNYNVVGYSIGTNPRAAKRLVLSYRLGEEILERREEKLQEKKVESSEPQEVSTTKGMRFAAHCLQVGYPDLYERLMASDVGSPSDQPTIQVGKNTLSHYKLLLELGQPGSDENVAIVPDSWAENEEDKMRLTLFLQQFVGAFDRSGDKAGSGRTDFDEDTLRSALGLPPLRRTPGEREAEFRPERQQESNADLQPFFDVVDDVSVDKDVAATAEAMLEWMNRCLHFHFKLQANPRVWSVFGPTKEAGRFGLIQVNNRSITLHFLNVASLNEEAIGDDGGKSFVASIYQQAERAANSPTVSAGVRVVQYSRDRGRIGLLGLTSEDDVKAFREVLKRVARHTRGQSPIEPAGCN